MNINDVKIDMTQFEGKDRLDVIFEKQNDLREKYGIPIMKFDVPADQSLAREMAWNTVEELGEALAVITSKIKDRDHLLDETADALSFYIELLLISGMSSDDFRPPKDSTSDKLQGWFEVDSDTYRTDTRRSHSIFVEKLALAINHLKNRKWRKTNLHTNEFLYRKDLYVTFLNFIRFVRELGITPDELFDAYVRKVEVNLFRIRSNY